MCLSENPLSKRMTEIIALFNEPLEGFSPVQVRDMFERYTSDDTVATILAGVSNQVGWLMHELDDPDNDNESVSAYRSVFHSWYALEQDLVKDVIRRLEEENQTTGSKYVTAGIGTHYIIKPFMERNGFVDGAGWWIKENEE